MESLIISHYLAQGWTTDEIAQITGKPKSYLELMIAEGDLQITKPVDDTSLALLEGAKSNELKKQISLAPAYAMAEARLLHKIFEAAETIKPDDPFAGRTLKELTSALRTLDNSAAAKNLANENAPPGNQFNFTIIDKIQ